MSVSEKVMRILEECQAVISGSHIVYTSGRHGRDYVNKDAVYPDPVHVSFLGSELASAFCHEKIEVVVAPEVGGLKLETWTAYHLYQSSGRVVFGIYAERDEEVIFKAGISEFDGGHVCRIMNPQVAIDVVCRPINKGETLFVRKKRFVIKRGYDKLVSGKRTLLVDDILTTGGSLRMVADAIRAVGGILVAAAVLCNRGNVTAEQAGVPKLHSLCTLNLESWSAEECPLCTEGVSINTSVGHGKEFLERKGKA